MNWKRYKVFYGWWIVAACFGVALYIGGIVIFGFTAIFEPVANEFGWSYAQISFAASLRGLEMGLLAPLMGLLVDRWGPRQLMFGGVILIGLGLTLLSRTTSLGMFWGVFALIAIGMSACVGTVMMTAVSNWFRKKLGIAAGIVLSGFGFSGLLIPGVVRLVDTYDWRTAMVIFGVGMWVIGLPLSLLLRRNPEQYGYLPDGEASSTVTVDESLTLTQTAEEEIGPRQALTSRAFWHIALALMCQMLVVMAVITHVMPYLSSIGITRSTSSLIAMGIPLVSIGGRLGFGWLGDKFDKRRVATVGFAMMGLGLLFFGYVANGGMWLLVPFFIFFGVGYGGLVIMRVTLVREYFGRSRFGTIHGFTIGVMMLGNLIGPPLAGWVFDNWGSYQGIWFVFAGLVIVALIIMATTPPIGEATRLADKG